MKSSIPSVRIPESSPAWFQILKRLPHPACVTDLQANPRMLYMNQAFTRKTGYRLKDTPTLGTWLRKVFPDPQYRKARVTEWKKGVFHKGAMKLPYVHEIRMLTKKGKWTEAVCSTMRHRDFLVFCFNDVTESKTNNQTLISALHALPYPIVFEEHRQDGSNKNPRLVFMNRTFQKRVGYNTKTCPRLLDLLRRIYPDPLYRQKVFARWLRACSRMNSKGEIPTIEARLKSRFGPEMDILLNTINLPNVGVRMVALTDITAQKKLIDALEREKEGIDKSRMELKERLRRSLSAGTIAHEIDTAMGAILLQSKLALNHLKKDAQAHPVAIHALQSILNQAEGVNLTIDRIRALISNLETRREQVDLKAVVQSALLALKDRIQEAAVQIETRYPSRPVVILGDETQLYLIIINLLRNAINALLRRRSSGRVIRLRLAVFREKAQIVVENSGTGESSRSVRQAAEWSIYQQGMGIGLFLVRSAVANHHGRVYFGTSKLKGWKVTVWLPVTPPPQKKT